MGMQTKIRADKRLNIAMVGHKRIPSREGGIEIVVEELSTRMAKLGHHVTCYNRAGHHVSGKEFDREITTEHKGVQLKEVFTIQRRGLAAVSSSFFGCLAAAFGPYDVVHIHAEGPAAFCWLPRLLGKRVVLTIHGLDWQREKWKNGFGAKYIHFGEKMGVKWANEIIVLSRCVEEYFKTTYNRDVRFIPNGVKQAQIREAKQITEKFGLTKDSYILYLGRIVPEKGGHYLCEAFKNINTDKKLVIVGGASDTDEYMKQLRELAKDDERIIFTGFMQGDILRELYSNAYVYVLPSDLEGMPLSLLEAMSYGNCCLTSDIPECAEVTRHHGVTFQKSNVADLKEKLQDLCDNPAKVQYFKSKAAKYIHFKYNWDFTVAETLAVYRGELSEKREGDKVVGMKGYESASNQ